MELDARKREIRELVKRKKKIYSPVGKKKKSVSVIKKLENDEWFRLAKIVMLYWSMDDEVFTHDLIRAWKGKKKIILPSVDGEKLVLKEFRSEKQLIAGNQFGILEPEGSTFDALDEIDLVIVPGVAFDKENNRLGRGKAFYDKLLQGMTAKKIGICFDFQYFNSIPSDINDVKMDKVISE